MFFYSQKTLKVKKQGHFSSYLIYKNQGIKVLHKKRLGFKSINSLKKSSSWKVAKREFNLLAQAQVHGLSPKVYDLVPILGKNKLWYPAIIMEHIPGVGLHKIYAKKPKKTYLWKNKRIKASELRDKLEVFFERKKIKHRDLHFANIVVKDFKTFKVIDFGLAHRIKS